MMANQIDNRWIENTTKQGAAHLYPSTNYTSAPIQESGSTGIRELFIEKLFTSCGSGSLCDAMFSQLKALVTRDYFSGDWTVILLPSGEPTEQILPSTTAEKLNEIRDAFGLSMAALADVLKASRASVYNWYENEPRSADINQRIERLHEIAQVWVAKNPHHFAPGRLMKQKLGNSPSMFDRLCREDSDLNEIRNGLDSLLALMNKQRERMDRAKTRSAKSSIESESHIELLERLTGSITANK